MTRHTIRRGYWQCTLLLAAALGVAGCGPEGPERYELSGNVTYQGQPVPKGEISFAPDSAQGNSGPGSVTRIENGQYETIAEGGLVGGPYVVRIIGFDGVPAGEQLDGSPLFEPYETQVDLPKEDGTRDFEVPAA